MASISPIIIWLAATPKMPFGGVQCTWDFQLEHMQTRCEKRRFMVEHGAWILILLQSSETWINWSPIVTLCQPWIWSLRGTCRFSDLDLDALAILARSRETVSCCQWFAIQTTQRHGSDDKPLSVVKCWPARNAATRCKIRISHAEPPTSMVTSPGNFCSTWIVSSVKLWACSRLPLLGYEVWVLEMGIGERNAGVVGLCHSSPLSQPHLTAAGWRGPCDWRLRALESRDICSSVSDELVELKIESHAYVWSPQVVRWRR
jgi:hypothetical protein